MNMNNYMDMCKKSRLKDISVLMKKNTQKLCIYELESIFFVHVLIDLYKMCMNTTC